jgi:hypothetical protein
MSAVIEVTESQGYILATYTGEFNVPDAKKIIDRVDQMVPQGKSRVLLLDCRQMTGMLSIIHRFQVAVNGQKLHGKILRIALVRSRERANADRFFETAAVNRGINLRLFADIDEATRWLNN